MSMTRSPLPTLPTPIIPSPGTGASHRNQELPRPVKVKGTLPNLLVIRSSGC